MPITKRPAIIFMFRCLSQRQAKKEHDVLFPFLFTCDYTICKVKSPNLLIDTGPNSEQSTSLISKPKPQSLKLLYFATGLHSTVSTNTLRVYRTGYSVSCIWLGRTSVGLKIQEHWTNRTMGRLKIWFCGTGFEFSGNALGLEVNNSIFKFKGTFLWGFFKVAHTVAINVEMQSLASSMHT